MALLNKFVWAEEVQKFVVCFFCISTVLNGLKSKSLQIHFWDFLAVFLCETWPQVTHEAWHNLAFVVFVFWPVGTPFRGKTHGGRILAFQLGKSWQGSSVISSPIINLHKVTQGQQACVRGYRVVSCWPGVGVVCLCFRRGKSPKY